MAGAWLPTDTMPETPVPTTGLSWAEVRAVPTVTWQHVLAAASQTPDVRRETRT